MARISSTVRTIHTDGENERTKLSRSCKVDLDLVPSQDMRIIS
jgi:hypothetical protein